MAQASVEHDRNYCCVIVERRERCQGARFYTQYGPHLVARGEPNPPACTDFGVQRPQVDRTVFVHDHKV